MTVTFMLIMSVCKNSHRHILYIILNSFKQHNLLVVAKISNYHFAVHQKRLGLQEDVDSRFPLHHPAFKAAACMQETATILGGRWSNLA